MPESTKIDPAPPSKPLIFVSHASGDRENAEALVAEIEASGIRCWIAPRDIPFGLNFGAAIIDAIESTQVFVFLLSASANRSVHVANEIERAVHYQKHLVPIRIEDVKPSREIEFFVSRPHWVDLFKGSRQGENNMGRLLDQLRDLLRAWIVPELAPLSGQSSAVRRSSNDAPNNRSASAAQSAATGIVQILFGDTGSLPGARRIDVYRDGVPVAQQEASRQAGNAMFHLPVGEYRIEVVCGAIELVKTGVRIFPDQTTFIAFEKN
jgi:hypothetical protein